MENLPVIVFGAAIGMAMLFAIAIVSHSIDKEKDSMPCSAFASYAFEDVPFRCITEIPEK